MRRIAGPAFALLGLWTSLGASLGASPARAAEPAIFEAFKAVCYDTRADPQKALAALAALGPEWSDAPAPASTQAGGTALRKIRVVGTERWTLALDQRDLPAEPDTPFAKRLSSCVMTTSAKATGLTGAVKGLMGRGPTERKFGQAYWTYADAPAGRRFLVKGGGAEFDAALAAAPLVIVMGGRGSLGEGAAFTETRRIGD